MRIILIIKSIINLCIGICIIVLREPILPYLSFVIAGALLVESIEDLLYVLVKKEYRIKKDALINPLAITFVGILLIVENIISPTPESNIEFVCILWGCVSIFSACKDISLGIYDCKKKKAFILHIIKGCIALVFAFLLMLNPLEHVVFHLVILGIEFIYEAILLSFHWIRYKKPTLVSSEVREEIEKIHHFIEEHPSKEEEILSSIHKK